MYRIILRGEEKNPTHSGWCSHAKRKKFKSQCFRGIFSGVNSIFCFLKPQYTFLTNHICQLIQGFMSKEQLTCLYLPPFSERENCKVQDLFSHSYIKWATIRTTCFNAKVFLMSYSFEKIKCPLKWTSALVSRETNSQYIKIWGEPWQQKPRTFKGF